jgi:hypothetical protein
MGKSTVTSRSVGDGLLVRLAPVPCMESRQFVIFFRYLSSSLARADWGSSDRETTGDVLVMRAVGCAIVPAPVRASANLRRLLVAFVGGLGMLSRG